MADAIAGTADHAPEDGTFPINGENVYAALTPQGTWQWENETAVFHGSLRQHAQQFHFRQYTQKRDMKCIYANEPMRWSKYSTSLLATLNKATHKSPRQIGRRS